MCFHLCTIRDDVCRQMADRERLVMGRGGGGS